MKKWIVILTCMWLLTACGREVVDPELVITCAPREEVSAEPTQAAAEPTLSRLGQLSFLAEGVELVPGAAFDPSALPEPESVYQVPSCAIEGTDNLYNYGTFELTAMDDGGGEVLYSIVLLDPDAVTPEGLTLGDDAQRVTELYGAAYTQEGTARVYPGTNASLYILLHSDVVASIEYRMNPA